MNVILHDRTEETVIVYFKNAQQPSIRRMLPQRAMTVEEALEDFARTQMPGATSYGQIVCVDGRYVGDIWIYCIAPEDTPNAMLSYCVFEQALWGMGVATEAIRLFLKEVQAKYSLKTIGAFTYAENLASIRVLEKNGFTLMEEFTEDGVVSRYYQWRTP